MTKSKSRLEDLPNEILGDIFKNLDARNLFRAFYNLNNRLNHLLQSFQYLQLSFHMNQSNIFKSPDEIYSHYVHTLIIDQWIHFNPKHFSNVRCLRLNNPLPNLVEQLKPDAMPNLEHLSVSYTYHMYEMDLLCERIFSNHFVNLKSCELFDKRTLMTISRWIQSPTIRILKTELIDSTVYKTILAACPNLYFLKFWMVSSNGIPTNIKIHQNLKRMMIDFPKSEGFYHDDDDVLDGFLACVPNLQYLEIRRRTYLQNIRDHLGHYDWLASIINYRLPILRRFKYCFYLLNDEKSIGDMDKNIFQQIQSDFINVHKGQYKAQLQINRESLQIN